MTRKKNPKKRGAKIKVLPEVVKWVPDQNMGKLLRPFYDMTVNVWTVFNQPVPPNNYEIVKWPAILTLYKYWKYWTAELVKEQNKSLIATQREVKAKTLNSYEKQIMICEMQLQSILRVRSELEAQWKKDMNALQESGKEEKIKAYIPNVPIETLLSKLNTDMGNFKMSKAQLEVAPMVDQLSEDTTIHEMEVEMESIDKKVKKAAVTKH